MFLTSDEGSRGSVVFAIAARVAHSRSPLKGGNSSVSLARTTLMNVYVCCVTLLVQVCAFGRTGRCLVLSITPLTLFFRFPVRVVLSPPCFPQPQLVRNKTWNQLLNIATIFHLILPMVEIQRCLPCMGMQRLPPSLDSDSLHIGKEVYGIFFSELYRFSCLGLQSSVLRASSPSSLSPSLRVEAILCAFCFSTERGGV